MSKCINNCGGDGPHFAPPSMGEPGFFTCKNDPSLGPPVNPITTADPPPDANCNTLPNGDCVGENCMHDAPEGEAGPVFVGMEAPPAIPAGVSEQVAKLVERIKRDGNTPIVLNAKLQTIDEIIQQIETDTKNQIAILTLAVVLATRRTLAGLKIADRGRRSKLIKAMAADFEAKLRKYVADK